MLKSEDVRLIRAVLTVMTREAAERSRGESMYPAEVALCAMKAVVCFFQAHAKLDAPDGTARDVMIQLLSGMNDVPEGRRTARRLLDGLNKELGLVAERQPSEEILH